MKKQFSIFLLFTTILIACGNSTPKTNQKQTPSLHNPDEKPDLFTPEEIAYNDSIKDIRMDYIRLVEEIRGNINNSNSIELSNYKIQLTGLTQQEAYLESYTILCYICLSSVSDYVNAEDSSTVLKQASIKILNKLGKDIIPLIDFPERKRKEDSIWKEQIDFVKSNLLKNHHIDMYKQPEINRGENMSVKFGKYYSK